MSSPCYLRESFQTFTKSAEERGGSWRGLRRKRNKFMVL